MWKYLPLLLKFEKLQIEFIKELSGSNQVCVNFLFNFNINSSDIDISYRILIY